MEHPSIGIPGGGWRHFIGQDYLLYEEIGLAGSLSSPFLLPLPTPHPSLASCRDVGPLTWLIRDTKAFGLLVVPCPCAVAVNTLAVEGEHLPARSAISPT